MPVINEQIEVAASPEVAWAKLTDFATHGEWMVPHVEFPAGGPDKLEVGVVYDEKMRLMGFPADIKWTIKAVQPGTRLDLEGKGPMGVLMTEAFVVEAAGEGSRITLDTEVKGGAVAMMAGKVTKATQEALAESLQKLAAILGK